MNKLMSKWMNIPMNKWTNESITSWTIKWMKNHTNAHINPPSNIAPPPILRIANTPMTETEISFARKTAHDDIGEKNTTGHRRGKNENGHPASEED